MNSAAHDEAAHKAHENYVRVINSNNIDELTTMFTEDVVFLAAGAKPIVGKAAVRAWADEYYKAYKTHWDKPVKDFVISGTTHSSATTTPPPTRPSLAARLSSTPDGASSSITESDGVGGSHAMHSPDHAPSAR